ALLTFWQTVLDRLLGEILQQLLSLTLPLPPLVSDRLDGGLFFGLRTFGSHFSFVEKQLLLIGMGALTRRTEPTALGQAELLLVPAELGVDLSQLLLQFNAVATTHRFWR